MKEKDSQARDRGSLYNRRMDLTTTTISQKLREMINSHSLPLGSTAGGRDWCLKALHPSDPVTEVRGIPDESSVPSVFMNYQTVATVSPATGATGTWSYEMQLFPHPVAFASGFRADSVGNTAVEVLNSQLSGVNHKTKFNTFYESFKRWRLAYASVTIYQDGPDLANQGTVVVCQKPFEPAAYSLEAGATGASAPCGRYHAFKLDVADLPSYANSQAMPNAYFGRSKEGVYVPMKLTRTHQTWHSARDLTLQAGSATIVSMLTDNPGTLQLASNTSTSSSGYYPFFSLGDCHFRSTDGNIYGDVTSAFCNECIPDISFRNLSVQTSLSMFYRFGFECQVDPQSPLSAHLKLSPESDPQAVEQYFRINREMKDAYPADFNDLAKILSVIGGIVKTIGPALSLIPVAGPILSGLSGPVSMGLEAVSGALRRTAEPSIGNTASQADKDRSRAAISKPVITARELQSARKKIGKKNMKKRR